MYGTPDITFVTNESTAFKTVALYPDPTSTRGSLPTNDVGGAGAGTSPAIVNVVYEHLNQLAQQIQ